MKTLRIVWAGLAFALTAASAPAAAVKDLTVVDFTHMRRDPGQDPQRSYEYRFGDWDGAKGAVQIPDKGLLIPLLGSKGGLGDNQGLDFRKHAKARIIYIVGNRNQASSFGFSMVDRDGTDAAWDIPLAGIAPGTPVAALVDLSKPSRTEKPGKEAGLNLKKLDSWQIKGNYQDKPVEVLILKIIAVTE